MAQQEIDSDCEKMSTLNDKNIDLENYRKLVKSYLDLVSFGESETAGRTNPDNNRV